MTSAQQCHGSLHRLLPSVLQLISTDQLPCRGPGEGCLSLRKNLQCPKLRVHPAPGVHISTTGCTLLGGVHPVCARFLSHLLLLYNIKRVHGAISGCTVLWEVHPASAQNKNLISDTDLPPVLPAEAVWKDLAGQTLNYCNK